jgi:hypothetical protein
MMFSAVSVCSGFVSSVTFAVVCSADAVLSGAAEVFSVFAEVFSVFAGAFPQPDSKSNEAAQNTDMIFLAFVIYFLLLLCFYIFMKGDKAAAVSFKDIYICRIAYFGPIKRFV